MNADNRDESSQSSHSRQPMARIMRAMGESLVVQAICLTLSALVLDGGTVFRSVLIAVFAHWLVVLLVARRSAGELSFTDRAALRFGFYFWLIAVGIIYPIVYP